MVQIKNGLVYVDGEVTQDPILIGYAVLDFAEQKQNDSNEEELIKAKAIQEYLLGRGANDENINDIVRKLESKVKIEL
jgi:hypothetical protein